MKIMDAIKNGYRVISVWQMDWDSCDNKQKYIREAINGTNPRTEN